MTASPISPGPVSPQPHPAHRLRPPPGPPAASAPTVLLLAWPPDGSPLGEPIVDLAGSVDQGLAWIRQRMQHGPDEVIGLAAPGALLDPAGDLDPVALMTPIALDPAPGSGALHGRTGLTAPREVRAWVTARTAEEPVSPIDTALVVSELVTNVERHAPGSFVVDLRTEAAGLLLAVTDCAPALRPQPRSPGSSDLSGRGLGIVEALCSCWGILVRPGSKTVWALLHRHPRP